MAVRPARGTERYVVGWTVFDARGLVTSDGGPIEAFIIVKCVDKEFDTDFRFGNQIVTWNQSKIWSDIELFKEEFESAFIEFNVMARNWFFPNDLVGSASLQLDSVNRRKNQVYAKKWLSLYADGDPTPKGMLQVTVFCLKPGQTVPSKDIQEGNDADADDAVEGEEQDWEDLGKAQLGDMEKGNDGRASHVVVNVQRVEHLPGVENVSGFNPFVTVEFVGMRGKTEPGQNVVQHAFDSIIKIPVVPPFFEDTILVKLWNYNAWSSDELMAQGFLSFSAIRSKPLQPRWFNFYGWDKNEITDIASISATGEIVEPNFYLGRLLLSARIERLGDDDELQNAHVEVAKGLDEPAQDQLVLFSDIYQVTGISAKEISVQISCAKSEQSTDFVQRGNNSRHPDDVDKLTGEELDLEFADVPSHQFTSRHGRVKAVVVMAPEHPESQPDVFINVYKRNFLSGKDRIAYARVPLSTVQRYAPGEAMVPRFFQLKPTPHNPNPEMNASVLMTLEKHTNEDEVRHTRKSVNPQKYCLRAYVYMARQIVFEGTTDPNPVVTLSCAGVSNTTIDVQGDKLRPAFMQCIFVDIVLCTSHAKQPPTMEPIQLTLKNQGYLSSEVIGRAVCQYTYMRQKTVKGFAMYGLDPQWIKVWGGEYGKLFKGEILVAFELLRKSEQPKLAEISIWPESLPATVHLAMLGLRDLRHEEGIDLLKKELDASNPIVDVRVRHLYDRSAEIGLEESSPEQELEPGVEFTYSEIREGGKATKKEDKNLRWDSGAGMNFEMLQTAQFDVWIPKDPIYDPCLEITVKNERTFMGFQTLGVARVPLYKAYPWPDPEHKWKKVEAKDYYLEMGEAERKKKSKALEDAKLAIEAGPAEDDEFNAELQSEKIDSAAVPEQARTPEYLADKANERIVLENQPMNMHTYPFAVNAWGERAMRKGAGGGGGQISRYEDNEKFSPDFYFKSIPLCKGSEFITDSDIEPCYRLDVFGFVKAAFKITAKKDKGHGAENGVALEDGAEGDQAALQNGDDKEHNGEEEQEEELWETQWEHHDRPDMQDRLKEIWDELKLRKLYKSKDHVPNRIRVRLYLVKAVCICGKDGPGSIANPYLRFTIGKETKVDLKATFKPETNSPDFYRVEERDVVFPMETRLEVQLWDCNTGMMGSDGLIGCTTIDLQDRWHSWKWKNANDYNQLPWEGRALWERGNPDIAKGTLTMWVQMVSSTGASELPATRLRKPPDAELEVRLVIWDTKKVLAVDNGHSDVKMYVRLECDGYKGSEPNPQETDVHFNCTEPEGHAKFNYRIVFRNIRMPIQTATITIEVYDYNAISAFIFIGQINLEVKRYLEKVARDMDALEMKSPGLKIRNMAKEAEEPGIELGSINMSMWVMTQQEANGAPVGLGWDEPNVNPTLIVPVEGRGWGDFFAGFNFNFGIPAWMIALIIVGGIFAVMFILAQGGLL
mmetsp:Transcript_45036/g.102042  ORF Transcript_45036/g.102042 Transcript_45036/m.102042 type:complete len:1451 (+) Transcript_45036:77-4429(+)